MKTKIQSFRPNTRNLLLMDSVLRNAIRNGFRNRNKSILPTFNKWNREDVREAIQAYRMIKATEVTLNVD